MNKENRQCKNGEINAITKEVFCNLHKEFCKFLKCAEKGGKE